MRSPRPLVFLLLTLTLSTAAAIWWTRIPRSSLTYANHSPDVGYVGDAACAECHQKLADSYARTAMGRSWGTPQSVEPIEQFDSSFVVDERLGFRYSVLKQGDKYFQEESRVDESGNKTHSLMREIRHVIGSGTHGRSYVAEHNGYLTIMPLSWFSQKGGWDLSPGYREHNQRFDREVSLSCAACHNSYPEFVDGSLHCFRQVPAGIGCERCHGPGAAHVRYRRTEASGSDASDAPDRTIVNPRHLAANLRDDVCAQCHLQSDVAFAASGKRLTDFRPGMRLGDYRRDFFLKQEDRESFGFSSHVPRMRLSACWSRAPVGQELTCISCHDPHVTLSEVPIEHYVQRCLRCHQAADCSRGPELRGNSATDNCIPCHMPKAPPKDMAHTLFTEHWIRAKPALRGEDVASKPQVAPRTVELIDFWAATAAAPAAEHAVALARFLDRSQSSNRAERQRAVDALERAARRQPNLPDLHYWLGTMLESMNQPARANRAYDRAARLKPNDPLILHALGATHQMLQRSDEAIASLQKAVDAVPEYLRAYLDLAKSLQIQGDSAAALDVLDRALDRYPYSADLRTQRASLLFGRSETPADAAVAALNDALQLDPDRTALLWLSANLQARRGKLEAALATLNAVRQRDPQSLHILLSLAALQAQTGHLQDARGTLNEIRALAPHHPAIEAIEQEIARHGK